MIKYFILLISILLCGDLFANDIEIQLLNATQLTSEPGKVNSFSIAITNRGASTTELLTALTLPENWKLITDGNTLKITGGQKINKVLSVLIPPKTIAGKYEIIYTLRDKNNPTTKFQEKFTFQISPTNKLEIVPLEAPATALSNAKVIGKFLLKNQSNQAQTIQLFADKASINGDALVKLGPFASQLIQVTANSFDDLRKETQLNFSIKGVILGTDISATGYLKTHLIPRLNYEEEEIRTLPGHISVNYLNRQYSDGRKGVGMQGELYLNGTLDENREKEITLSLRGPNQQDENELSLYDEYYASYQDQKFSATIGDNTFKLSTLTEFSRNGTGIKTQYQQDDFTIGGFYLTPRFYPDLKKEIGLFVKKEFTRTNSFSFNFLQKDFLEAGEKASILSIEGKLVPFKNALLETEIASSNGGQAAYVNFHSAVFKRLRMNANFIYASPNFEGYFSNSINIFANVNYNLSKKVDLFVGIYQDDRNAALDTLLSAAPYSNRKNIGIRFKLDATSRIQIGIRKNNIEDRLPTKQFYREEQLLNVQINKNFNHLNFSLNSEYGQAHNFLQSTETDLQTVFRSFADIQIKIRNFSIQTFGQYYNHNSLLLPQQKQVLWGGGISGEISRNTQFNIRYQNDFAVEEYYKNRNSFDLYVSQRVKNNHQLMVNARQTIRRNTFGKKDFAMSLKYVWTFGIPLEKRPAKGNVYGQIQRKDGSSAADILVFLNGKTAITDEAGKFHFKAMKPGKYPLMIDKSTLKLHEIMENSTMPIVEILPDFDQSIAIELLQSGALYGEMEMNNEDLEPQNIALKNIGNLMIEVKNGEEIRRTFTDENGKYHFADLRPGQWEVVVLTHQLDKNIMVKKTGFTVEIGTGEKAHLPIQIQKKQRKIQFKNILTLSDD